MLYSPKAEEHNFKTRIRNQAMNKTIPLFPTQNTMRLLHLLEIYHNAFVNIQQPERIETTTLHF